VETTYFVLAGGQGVSA